MKKVYVVDASTSLKWIFEDEVFSKKALKLLNAFLKGEVDLIAPNLWIYEMANGIKSASLRKKSNPIEGYQQLKRVIKLQPNLINIEEEIELCLKMSFKYNISIYDSAYVTLAQANKIKLISSDVKLVEKIENSKLAIGLDKYGG